MRAFVTVTVEANAEGRSTIKVESHDEVTVLVVHTSIVDGEERRHECEAVLPDERPHAPLIYV